VTTDDLDRSSSIFRSTDIDEMQRLVSGILRTQSLRFATADHSLDGQLQSMALPHVVAAQVRFGGDVEAIPQSVDDCYFVYVPVAGTLLIRAGRTESRATPARLAVVSPPGPATVIWHRDAVAVVLRIDRAAVEAELVDLTDLAGPPADPPLVFQSIVDATDEPLRSWRATALFAADNLAVPGGLFENPQVAATVERLLLRGLVVCHPHTYSDRLADAAGPPPPWHVRDAVRVMQERPAHPFTVATLARSVGISARALQDGFRQHLGMSPMQYLRTVRLRAVRDELLALDAEDSTTVADVATRWGFTHLGRFAQYYRARYGEAPSRTLRGP
jgi:AraC-like DNA-binding protein